MFQVFHKGHICPKINTAVTPAWNTTKHSLFASFILLLSFLGTGGGCTNFSIASNIVAFYIYLAGPESGLCFKRYCWKTNERHWCFFYFNQIFQRLVNSLYCQYICLWRNRRKRHWFCVYVTLDFGRWGDFVFSRSSDKSKLFIQNIIHNMTLTWLNLTETISHNMSCFCNFTKQVL